MSGRKLLIGCLSMLVFFGCDGAKQNQAQVPITLEIDVNWVVQNELENLADEMRKFLHAHGYAYLQLKQQVNDLVLAYRPQAEHDLMTELQTSFTHVMMEELAEPPSSDKRQIRIQLPKQMRVELLNKSRTTNMQAIEKSFLRAGVQIKAIPVTQARFTLAIPKNQYDHKQLQAFIQFQQLEFYLVSKESKPEGAYVVQDKNGQALYLEREPVLTGKAIENAEAVTSAQLNQPALNVSLHDEEAEIMQAFTQENIGRSMAVVLKTEQQARVLSVASIQGVFGKRFVIAGLDSMEEANNLANFLVSGELAAPMRVVSDKTKTE